MNGYQRNLFDYLESAARRLPGKTAFSDERQSLTFGELYARALAVGLSVAETAGTFNRPVAVIASRSTGPVVGMLGALAAGSFYVPVDAKTPPERMRALMEDLRPALILVPAEKADPFAWLAEFAPLLPQDRTETEVPPETEATLAGRRERILDADPAYMIFTSGSTGRPKGIPVSHRSVIDFTEWMAEACGVTENDVLGNQAPFHFDLSVKDLYQTLKLGASCVILGPKCFSFPLLLVRALNEHGVTTLIWATSAFRMTAVSGVLEREVPHTVKKIILGGEALQAAHLNIWRRALPECRFINLYGPTEVTVDCAWFPIDPEKEYRDGEPVPIGKACRNMEILLLGEDLRPVPDGEPGEICVRGTGLAKGYYNDPEKTARAFVQNPLNPHYPDLLYRTGDIAKKDGDGNLVFLARADDQIKRAGYRIELGEIESALAAVGGIGEAVCLFDAKEDRLICVYGGSAKEEEIAAELGKRLPRYMIPNEYRPMKALPHNANGKIDRAELKKSFGL